jgi:hypothetical protein
MSFNFDGSLLATSSKDKVLRVIDPRKGEVIQQGESHMGAKASRLVWCGSLNMIFTTGFSKMNERQYGVWNPVRPFGRCAVSLQFFFLLLFLFLVLSLSEIQLSSLLFKYTPRFSFYTPLTSLFNSSRRTCPNR